MTDPAALVLPETVSVDKWLIPLSEPLFNLPRSEAALLATAVYEGEPSDVAVTVPDFFSVPFSEPLYSLPYIPTVYLRPDNWEYAGSFLDITEVEKVRYLPLEEPVRTIPINPSAYMPFVEIRYFLPIPFCMGRGR